MEQHIRYCTSADGTRIAYAVAGKGPPLVRAGTVMGHLEREWESALWSHPLRRLAKRHLLVRYDARGTGLSDRQAADLSNDRNVEDLAAVVDAAGLERFALLGSAQGGGVAIRYAAEHPERVSHLVLHATYARGRRHRGNLKGQREAIETIDTVIRHGWDSDNPAYRNFVASLCLPNATADQLHEFNELQRACADAQSIRRIAEVQWDLNVTDALPRVQSPTLVLHCRDDAFAPFEMGQELAARIPGARLVPIDGKNHLLIEGDPAEAVFFEELEAFLGGNGARWLSRRGLARQERALRHAMERAERSPLYKILALVAALGTVITFAAWLLQR
jgi:pimeloyl-ACP methyl ester carboxylesterase